MTKPIIALFILFALVINSGCENKKSNPPRPVAAGNNASGATPPVIDPSASQKLRDGNSGNDVAGGGDLDSQPEKDERKVLAPPPNSTEGPSTPGGVTTYVPSASGGAPSRRGQVASPRRFVKIESVNGTYNPNHPKEISIHADDVVMLQANEYVQTGRRVESAQSAERLKWASDIDDLCESGNDCLDKSRFETNKFGVTYYPPAKMPKTVTISVTSNADGVVGDQIILRNLDYGNDDTEVITDPSDYPAGGTLNPNVALRGMGRWVTIDGTRFFSPYPYITDEYETWAPYQVGYWEETDYGRTWFGLDPWSWITDHYGVWRHYKDIGWLWLPFNDMHYEPHCVTFVQAGDYVAWFPFYRDYPAAYRMGLSFGFDDGYWYGYKIGLNVERYSFGFTIVSVNEIASRNISTVIYRGNLSAPQLIPLRGALVKNQFYAQPREGDRLGLPRSQIQQITSRGGARFFIGKSEYKPRMWSEYYRNLRPFERPIPIGSVMRIPKRGSPELIRPGMNGRGLAVTPLIKDSSGQVKGLMSPLRRDNLEIDPRHPLAQTITPPAKPLDRKAVETPRGEPLQRQIAPPQRTAPPSSVQPRNDQQRSPAPGAAAPRVEPPRQGTAGAQPAPRAAAPRVEPPREGPSVQPGQNQRSGGSQMNFNGRTTNPWERGGDGASVGSARGGLGGLSGTELQRLGRKAERGADGTGDSQGGVGGKGGAPGASNVRIFSQGQGNNININSDGRKYQLRGDGACSGADCERFRAN